MPPGTYRSIALLRLVFVIAMIAAAQPQRAGRHRRPQPSEYSMTAAAASEFI